MVSLRCLRSQVRGLNVCDRKDVILPVSFRPFQLLRVNKTLTQNESEFPGEFINRTRFLTQQPQMKLNKLAYLKRAFSILLMVGLSWLLPTAATANEDQWADTIARTAQSVVSLQLSQLRTFDGADQGGSGGTGFIVDAERGIILTNRHIVGTGPIRFSATFQNQERVDAVPLYRDPVHDFAFVQYDPGELQYAQPSTLELRPDKVTTGLNIRVLGSDGGEQLSILTGTIARLDREAPSYGRYGYNDFNTFYLQAASSTSGGSSGSPVIDFEGHVVALNAAANTRTASSFFLPLYRVQHALEKLQNGEKIDRGSFQTLFSHRPFRSLKRLGLPQAQEQEIRALDPTNTGLLVVAQVLPGGVAENVLQEGDIIYSVDGKLIPHYVALESLLDESIGKNLNVELVRQGELQTVEVGVADLHKIAPSRFLEIGDSIFQNMSIQHSRAMNRPQEGVVVVDPGYFLTRDGIPTGSVITEFDGEPVANIDDLLRLFNQAVGEGGSLKRKLVRFVVPGREFTSSVATMSVDNRWFKHRECSRVDGVRFWDCQSIDLPESVEDTAADEIQVPGFRDPLLNRVAPALVRADFHIPYSMDNVYAHHFNGVGIVVDKEEGLIALDRNTVPVGLGDAEVTFFGSTRIDASVVFLHPSHNVALLKYDPKQLNGAEFQALELQTDNSPLEGELYMVGYRQDGTFRKHAVDDFSRLTIGFEPPRLARFQQSIVDAYGVPDMPPSLGGPLVDADGIVRAVWMSFAYQEGQEIQQQEWAMPAQVVAEAVRLYKSGARFRSFDAILDYRPIALARERGLPDEWLSKLQGLASESRRVLYLQQLVVGTDAEAQLRVGDFVLAINGELVADFFRVEQLVQAESVDVTVLREGEVFDVTVRPSEVSGFGTERIVQWAGATFQEAHRDVALYNGVNPDGVYISGTVQGSPALWDRLYRNRFVTAVDGVDVTNLDEFLDEILTKKQDEITRLSVLTVSGRRGIVSVQPEFNFWPTVELKRNDSGWQRIDHSVQ